MAGIALFSGPQDPSQLENLLNQIILATNPYVTGTSPIPSFVTTATTAANLPAFGTVILGSTVASAAYVLPAPVKGQSVELVTQTTKAATVTLASGTFNKNHTKLTLKTTTGNTVLQASVQLTGLSTSVWGITGFAGSATSVKST